MDIASFFANLFFTFATISVITARVFPLLNPFLYYGKVLTIHKSNTKVNATSYEKLLGTLQVLTIPKSWFIHFYLVSCIVSAILWLKPEARIRDVVNEAPNNFVLLLILFTTQSVRRLIECITIEKMSNTARIHVSHYLVGIAFYCSIGIALRGSISTGPSASSQMYLIIVSIAIFIICSLYQTWCHKYLSTLVKYSLPDKGLFCIVSCPHYLMEIGIYFALVLLDINNTSLWLALIWVMVNLSASAEQSRLYYKKKFPHQNVPYYAIIPGII